MEHRWNARRFVTGEVVVECPRWGKLRASMCDVSLGGMFIEGISAPLTLNTPVMVSFRLPARESDGGYHLHAMVVRRAARGIGLMFLDLGSGTFEALRSELRALGVAAHSDSTAPSAESLPSR